MANVAYFKGATTLEDARMMAIHHMQEQNLNPQRFETMTEQFRKALLKVGDFHKYKSRVYKKRIDSISPAQFLNMMSRIVAMDGLKIENDGTWFWISGNTKAHKEELAEIGREVKGKAVLAYSGKRQAWYYKDIA